MRHGVDIVRFVKSFLLIKAWLEVQETHKNLKTPIPTLWKGPFPLFLFIARFVRTVIINKSLI